MFKKTLVEKTLVVALVNLLQMESKIQNLQLLFEYQFQNILPNNTL